MTRQQADIACEPRCGQELNALRVGELGPDRLFDAAGRRKSDQTS